MHHDRDLFGALPATKRDPDGLRSWLDVITRQAEIEAIARIDETDLSPFRFQGWLGKRLTKSFGWTYDFDTGRFERGDPMPDWLSALRDDVARHAQIDADSLVQALIIRYDPGAGIGWHKDMPVFEDIFGLSLGNPATLRFRRRREGGFDRFAHDVPPRSLYRLSGEVRNAWEHSIAEMTVPRWSVTFRTLRERSDS